MKSKSRKLSLIGTIFVSMLSVCSAGVSFSIITFANYIESKAVSQTLTKSGKENYSLFLNANIWTTGVDSSGNIVNPVYYMWVIIDSTHGKLVVPSRHINVDVTSTSSSITTKMDMYVFEYEYVWAQASRGILFIRADANTQITDYSTFPSVWNQTPDISYSAFLGDTHKYNYFCIESWDDNTAKHNSTYSCNRIDKNSQTGELTWLHG